MVRARVISPKGTVAELDGSLVSDAPLVATSATVFSDRRALHVPLPRFEIGSVIEEEMITKDREPILAAGSVETVWLGAGVPTAATRVVLSAPSGLKARQVANGLPAGAKPRHEVKGGRETWTYELGALAARDDAEPSVPSYTSVMPYVGITTAPSWGAVAKSYLAVVEKRLADGPVTMPAELPRTPTIESVRTIVPGSIATSRTASSRNHPRGDRTPRRNRDRKCSPAGNAASCSTGWSARASGR